MPADIYSTGEFAGEIRFPPEWILGKTWELGHPEVVLTADNETIIAAAGVLVEGANLMGLCWPGGQRVYRISGETGWAIEERFEGDAPKRVRDIWRVLIDSAVEAVKRAEAEMGGRPGAA